MTSGYNQSSKTVFHNRGFRPHLAAIMMNHAIIGAGNIGRALARAFARQGIEVGLANSRGPETLAALAQELGPSVHAHSVQEALQARMIFLAVPFPAHRTVAEQLPDWQGKILVDTTNALRIAPEALAGRLSSDIVAQAFAGARLVKGFNHLPAAQLGTNPPLAGQRQAIFLSSNDAAASASVAGLVQQLGFAPVELGRIDQGGAALHVVDGKPGGLLFQNLASIGEAD